MLKKYSLGLMLSGIIFAGQMTTITFFPSSSSSPTYINEQYDRLSVYRDVMTISSLPAGIIPESLDVLDPVYERLSFRYDFDSPETFYSKLMGKTVYFETDEGARKESTFIKKQGPDIFVRQGSQLVVNPAGRLFVPLNERYSIEPELDIEVSSRYKAYKQASISYYNHLLTSQMQYEFKFYTDSNTIVVLSDLIVDNRSNKDWNGSISYSSKTPLFSSPRGPVVYALHKERSYDMAASVEDTMQPSELFKETLKKSYEIPIGKTKISLYQLNLDGVERFVELTFPMHQQESYADRVLRITNNSNRVLLPGSAHMYIDDELSLLSSIPYTSIGDVLTIPLSKIREIKGTKTVVREAVNGPDQRDDDSVVFKVMIDVSNMSDQDVSIMVQDELPYGALLSKEFEQHLDRKGRFSKMITLSPREKRKLDYTYSLNR